MPNLKNLIVNLSHQELIDIIKEHHFVNEYKVKEIRLTTQPIMQSFTETVVGTSVGAVVTLEYSPSQYSQYDR